MSIQKLSEIDKIRIHFEKERPKQEFMKNSFNVSDLERKERVNNVLINQDCSDLISGTYDCVICLGLCYQPLNCKKCKQIFCEQCLEKSKKMNP